MDVTRFDHIRNYHIRQRLDIAPIAERMRETRFRRYVHVLRRENYSLCKIGIDPDVSEKRPRKRPKQHWFDTIHSDMKLAALHPD
ncbi:hypothetical protein RB195_000369 [Necator americanus]|uniref:Uncharacterized protein n=1 Tax=Necator americanus TaxID=51031 RepID=A0ABR1D9C1_NECAM